MGTGTNNPSLLSPVVGTGTNNPGLLFALSPFSPGCGNRESKINNPDLLSHIRCPQFQNRDKCPLEPRQKAGFVVVLHGDISHG